MTQLLNLLQPQRLTHIVDIGANPIDGHPPYKSMLDQGLCYVTGFEPQANALAQLNKQKSQFENYLPYAVGDGQTHTLNICKGSGMTSLLEPDLNVLSVFPILKPYAEIIEKVPLQTRKLDDIEEIKHIDFLKIDIQGSELSVFQSGQRHLKNAVAIQTEISFMTLYKNQPSFGEIDIELRAQGFVPHTFEAVKKWPIAPFVSSQHPRQAINQLLEADIIYVKDFTRADLFSNEQLKHLALLSHYCFKSYDLCLHCMQILVQRGLFSNEVLAAYAAGIEISAV